MPRSFNATPKPFNFKSTQQSPSFIKAVKPPSSNGSGNKFEYSLPHHHHQCTTKCHPRDVICSLVSSQNLDYAIFSLCLAATIGARPFCFELLFYHFLRSRQMPCMCTDYHPGTEPNVFMFDIKVPFFMQRNPDLIIFANLRVRLESERNRVKQNGVELEQKKTFKSLTKPLTNFFLGPNLAEPIKLDINPELKNMINSDNSTPVYQPSATKPVSAPVKTFEPSKEWSKAKKSLLFLRLILINDFDQFDSGGSGHVSQRGVIMKRHLKWKYSNTQLVIDNYHSCSLTHRSTP